jgi:hypothetical protein
MDCISLSALVISVLGVSLFFSSHDPSGAAFLSNVTLSQTLNQSKEKSPKEKESMLIYDDDTYARCLSDLFTKLKIPLENSSLPTLVDKTQKLFLRPSSKERWEIGSPYENSKEELLPVFIQLGLVREIKASGIHYTYGLVLGATFERVHERLNFLLSEWERGVRFDKLVFLTGERKLSEKEQTDLAQFTDKLIRTESEMMLWVYNSAKLPPEIKALPFIVINAPAQPGAPRATTKDTILAWLEQNPQPGPVLVASSQPYINYQHTVLSTFLPEKFYLESIGPAAPFTTTVGEYLDTIARWLYQEQQRRQTLSRSVIPLPKG